MMDLYGSQMIETSRKPNNPYDILKKALHFLLPMSLMSFLLLSYDFQFSSALVFTLFSHALERKYMFLICNGILAFLAKTLTFTSSFTVSTTDLDYMCPPFNIQPPDTLDQLDGELGNKGIDDVASDENDDKTTKDAQLQDEEEEKQEIFESVEDEDESHGGALKVLETENGGEEEEEEEEEEERGLLVDEEENDMNINTEELNRKIEEFIRKMKEEIRTEAKQHLIAV